MATSYADDGAHTRARVHAAAAYVGDTTMALVGHAGAFKVPGPVGTSA